MGLRACTALSSSLLNFIPKFLVILTASLYQTKEAVVHTKDQARLQGSISSRLELESVRRDIWKRIQVEAKKNAAGCESDLDELCLQRLKQNRGIQQFGGECRGYPSVRLR